MPDYGERIACRRSSAFLWLNENYPVLHGLVQLGRTELHSLARSYGTPILRTRDISQTRKSDPSRLCSGSSI
jgi:hypothetical protein